MIKSKSLFIIGAGGSIPYGLPTSKELKDIILCDTNINIAFTPPFLKDGYLSKYEINSENPYFENYRKKRVNMFKNFGFDEEEIGEFHQRFLKSNIISIDRFIHTNPSYYKIGKIAIAQALLNLEPNYNIFYRREENWFTSLWNKIYEGSTKKNFSLNNISFITFNYDRILEYLLYNSFKNSYEGLTVEDTENIVQVIPVIHVYGQLGKLDFEKTNMRIVPFGIKGLVEDSKKEFIEKGAQNIRLFTEKLNQDIIHNIMFDNDFKHIYLLGFGYDQSNLKRIFTRKSALLGIDFSNVVIKGTAFKGNNNRFSNNQIEEIKTRFWEINDTIDIDLYQENNLDFIENHVELR